MTNPVSPNLNEDQLEARAAAQRRQIGSQVVELRETIKHKVDPRAQMHEHILQTAGVAALLGVVLGYYFGGIFDRRY